MVGEEWHGRRTWGGRRWKRSEDVEEREDRKWRSVDGGRGRGGRTWRLVEEEDRRRTVCVATAPRLVFPFPSNLSTVCLLCLLFALLSVCTTVGAIIDWICVFCLFAPQRRWSDVKDVQSCYRKYRPPRPRISQRTIPGWQKSTPRYYKRKRCTYLARAGREVQKRAELGRLM